IDKASGFPWPAAAIKDHPFAFSNLENRMVIGTGKLLLESDPFDVKSSIINLNRLGVLANPVNFSGFQPPLVYGCRLGSVANAFVLWVGAGSQVLVRTAGRGLPGPTAYAGGPVQDIAEDPFNYNRAAVLDSNQHVWLTSDAGQSFIDITGNLLNGFDNT